VLVLNKFPDAEDGCNDTTLKDEDDDSVEPCGATGFRGKIATTAVLLFRH
jgi:hypothetical protein